MLNFLQNGFNDDCYCGVITSDLSINRHAFKTSFSRRRQRRLRLRDDNSDDSSSRSRELMRYV